MGMGKREEGVKLLSELSGLSVAIHKKRERMRPLRFNTQLRSYPR